MAKKTTIIDSNQAQYTSAEFAKFNTELFSDGVMNTRGTNDDLKVVQHGAGDMTVDINSGACVIDYFKNSIYWKIIAESNATENISIPANSGGTQRIDAIIVRISQDEPNSLKNNLMTIERVNGTGATPLTDGDITTAVGDLNWQRLANIVVNPGDTQILTNQILDTREVIEFGRNAGGYKTIFRGDGKYLDNILNSPVDENIIPDIDLTYDIGAIDYPSYGLNRRFRNVYAQRYYGSAQYLTDIPGGNSLIEQYTAGENIELGDAVYIAKNLSYDFDRIFSVDSNNYSYQTLHSTFYIAQSFRTDRFQNILTGFKFKMRRNGNPTGNFILRVYLAGADFKPTGSALATYTITASSLSIISNDWLPNWINLPSPLTVTPLTNYVVTLALPSGTLSPANNFDVWYNQYRNYTEGYLLTSTDHNTWTVSLTGSLDFWIKGSKQWEGEIGKVYRAQARWISEKAFSFVGIAQEAKLADQTVSVKRVGSSDLLSQSILAVTQQFNPGGGNTNSFGGQVTLKGVGQSFTGDGTAIEAIELVNLAKQATTSYSNVYVKIYSHSGVYGTSSIPGTLLATSEPVAYDNITATTKFVFNTPFQTVNGTYYVMTLEFWGSYSAQSRYITYYYQQGGGATHSGNICTLNSSNVWSATANQDLMFKIYGRSTAVFTPNTTVYLSDLAGGYSNTPGTNSIKIAIAYTTQKIMIINPIMLSYVDTVSYIYSSYNPTQVTNIILGYRPKSIELSAVLASGVTNNAMYSTGFVDEDGNNRCITLGWTTNMIGVSQPYAFYLIWSGSYYIQGIAQIFDWGFRLTITGTSTGTAYIAYKVNSILTLL